MIYSWKKIYSILIVRVFFVMHGACCLAWAEMTEYEGIIEPSEVVEVGSPVGGIVARVMVDRGSRLEQGQPLVELESSVEAAALEEITARATFTGDINEQRAQLAFAKRSHQRIRGLNVIPLHEKDQAATQVALAESRLRKALENRTLAELEQNKAEAALARRFIKSPLSGIVMDRYVSPGEYVGNQPLLRIARIDPLRVEVIVPATIFGTILPGQQATIFPELSGYGQPTATVTTVDRFIDAASNTFGVRLELANGELKIPSGLKCQVRFTGESQTTEAATSVSPEAAEPQQPTH